MTDMLLVLIISLIPYFILTVDIENVGDGSSVLDDNVDDPEIEDQERKVSNMTLTVILAELEEKLPSAEPLVGTYPHDFSMTLPSISRRSFRRNNDADIVHTFEGQGSSNINKIGIKVVFRVV